ncbi:hypothetical protein FE236_02125 [Mariprofundus erugo]|uniref:hypothetical protein n=1 Tax=Mariprofundus erugo TaxID=2528639 RepID=UPI0010FE1D52|nr:hypothetical protein [Mariprofundus erugo]TLS77919.1 hypothetical protein FE236_02125 [Mariprofundus erugo]
MIQYTNPTVEFFDKPNNIGYSTNINFTIFANGKHLDATAQVTDGFQSYSLCGDYDQIAAELGVPEDDLSIVFDNAAFSLFCQEAIDKAFWRHHRSSPAYDYLFGDNDDDVEVLYDCQVAPAYWSPLVLKCCGHICLLATNSYTDEVRIAELSEDDLKTIDDDLQGMPWSDADRATYLLNRVGV